MLHVQRYLAALAVVLTMLGAYALAVAPWLAPPPVSRAAALPATSVAPSAATQADLARLFPPEAWQRQEPKILEADGCTLLVQDYKPTPDGKLELIPCTVIFYTAPEGDPRRRPVAMQAPQGAVIQFDRKLDFARGQFGKLLGGRLPGEITITSPETSPGAGDALHLTTRNLQIDKQRVFTPHDVEFRFGESHGRGRDLTIALLPKDPEDPSSGIGGMRSLTLARIDRLHLETTSSGLLAGGAQGRNANRSARQPTPLEVTCQGPFVFDVLSRTATFEDQVLVERVSAAGPPDRLLCSQLLLEFAEAAEGPSSQDTAKAATDDPLSGRLQRVVAAGSPATLEAPSTATRATAASIEYSLAKQRLVLLPGPGAEQVSLSRGENQFTARELEYELAEPGRLGRMSAAGPGELKVAQQAGPVRQTIVARWGRQLRIQPDGPNQVISLVGKAAIAADPLGQFAADELHLWVSEEETGTAGDRRQGTGDRGQQGFNIVPDRLLATGSVTVDSPKLHVATSRLEAWFHNQPPQPKPLPPMDPRTRSGPLGDPIAARPDAGPLRPPALQKFDLAGELIQMEIIQQGQELQLENLTIRGDLVLTEITTPEPGQRPIRITGQRLELRGGVTGLGTIDIVGEPAEIGGRGLVLSGSEIHLVRADSRLWIDGPGEATLPAILKAPTTGRGDLGQRSAAALPFQNSLSQGPAPQQVHVVWQDGLTFDGQKAEVTGQVQARTATQVATSKTLAVWLSERINFADLGASDQIDLARLVMEGGVFLVSRGLDERGEQESYEQIQVQDLTIDRAAGTLHASGPGWASSTRVPLAALPGATAGAPRANPALPVDPMKPRELNYVHIAFEGAIVGDLARNQIEFQRQVRTTFAPVADWEDRVHAERLEDLGEKGVLMTSERLTVIEMSPAGQPRWIEASASGGVIVDGKKFKVSAPRIAYTSDKQVLTLEGDGRADAQLWYQTTSGQPPSTGAARKWRYWLRTGMFDVEDARPFEFQLNGIDKIRLPGRR